MKTVWHNPRFLEIGPSRELLGSTDFLFSNDAKAQQLANTGNTKYNKSVNEEAMW